jgi:hypothetical protein
MYKIFGVSTKTLKERQMNDLIMEPLKYYDEQAQEEHRNNAVSFFEDLVKKSGVDVEANHKTVKEYNDQLSLIDKIGSKLSKFRGLRIFLVIAFIVGIVVAIGGIVQMTEGAVWPTGVLMLLIGLVVGGLSFYFWIWKVNPIIKDSNAVLEEHKQKADALLSEAYAQMAQLNSLFDDTDVFRVFEKTIPEFSFNNKFTLEHEKLMATKNDFVNCLDGEDSVTDTLAGTMFGNPFLYYRFNSHKMGTQDYEGSLYIEWTETYRDSDGNLQTRNCSQTLYATVTKPKPFYSSSTFLAYGCQAAPDLSFTHDATHAERMTDKEWAKTIKKGEKELQKQARKATKEGGNFQEMANSEFDVMFNASDRDNEVQFRLMYTPLAQRNTVALMRNKSGWGDDFRFIKQRRNNTIISEHSQNWDMNTSAEHYKSYDIEDSKSKFLNYNFEFFRSVFFDFAPLLAVPAYTESPVASMEEPEDFGRNYTDYEYEALANSIGESVFAADGTVTKTILKTRFDSRNGDQDVVNVDAYSYTGVERIDYVPVLGGDKRFHNVPVPWMEYIPLEKTSQIQVKALNMSEREFKNSDVKMPDYGAYRHGLLAYLLAR